MMGRDNSKRYLNAYCEIEGALRHITGSGKDSFRELVKKSAVKNRVIRAYAEDLFEFTDLRNAIVHKRITGEAIAEPHFDTVLELEKIRDVLINPPVVIPLFEREVTISKPDDKIGKAAKIMLHNSFSQVPIYQGREFKGLLTSHIIARWLASKFETGIGLLEEENVSEVQSFNETADNYIFIGRNCTLFEVLQYFDDFAKRGRNLDAIIITHSGSSLEKPIGIITIFDLPDIHRYV